MSDEIVVTRDVLKALGADTRVAILKALTERQKTQSELATELKLSTPTVLEHLDHLVSAGLVDRIDEGRKWKYYKLTKTGAQIVSRSPVHVVMILSFSLLVALAAIFLIAQKTVFFTPISAISSTSMITNAVPIEDKTIYSDQKAEEGTMAKAIDANNEAYKMESKDTPFMNDLSTSSYGTVSSPVDSPPRDPETIPQDGAETMRANKEEKKAESPAINQSTSAQEYHPSIVPEAIILAVSFTTALICAWYLMRKGNAYKS